MEKKAVVLLSGGLDSTLAVRILQEQGIEVEALNIRTQFSCCKDDALAMGQRFGVRVTMISVGEDYLRLIEKPKYGTGRGVNPCVDCRIYMFQIARRFMEQVGASFVATGEVLGQRPMSQQRHQMKWIEKDSRLQGLLLRPLSAKLLEPTQPEEEGIVDRERLYDISGRSRHRLLELAQIYGIEEPPTPSNGCLLTEPDYARKVRDLFDHQKGYNRWDFEVLKVGRHFRINGTKVVLGRNAEENERLELLAGEGCSLLVPLSFKGPSALIVGERDDPLSEKTMELILRYSKQYDPADLRFRVKEGGETKEISLRGRLIAEEEIVSLRV